MSRKNSFAGVYMFLNVYTKKVYIGESRNILRRLVDHRCTSNSIIHQLGVNNFVPVVLESEFTDPKLKDPEYRSKREAHYIKSIEQLTQSMDITVGQNRFILKIKE